MVWLWPWKFHIRFVHFFVYLLGEIMAWLPYQGTINPTDEPRLEFIKSCFGARIYHGMGKGLSRPRPHLSFINRIQEKTSILAINDLYRSLCVRSLSLNDKAIWASFLMPLVLKVTECTWLSAKSLKRGLNSYFSPVVRNFGRSYARNKINKKSRFKALKS